MSKLDSDVKLVKDMTIRSFCNSRGKRSSQKDSQITNKRINVVVDDLGENRYCGDIAVVLQLQILKRMDQTEYQ